MLLLMLTTVLWAFSFSLIGVYLSGQVDTWFAVLIRIALAFVIFLPFLRRRDATPKQLSLFMLLGAFQLGFMYLFYYQSFLYLTVPEVLLFTIMTPIYVTLIYDVLSGRRFRPGYFLTALLAVIGAAIIRYDQLSSQFLLGLICIQGANICFAIGQVGYKRLMEVYPMPQHNAFAWFYLGALAVAVVGWILFGSTEKMPTTALQWGILVWLGVGASGLGYFMWNYGATQVDAGTLAIMNNVLIPAGLLVNFVLWQHHVDWLRLIIGGGVIVASVFVHKYWVLGKGNAVT
jgi:carboxylate/amino acid/amine transporter